MIYQSPAAGIAVLFGFVLGVASQARSFELGVGIEGLGTGAFAQNPAVRPDGQSPSGAGLAGLGVLVEERFDGDFIAFEVFEDAQTPFALQTGGISGTDYVPCAVGVRSGLRVGPFIPYLGVLFEVAALVSRTQGSPPLSSGLIGVGGDLGADWVIADFRLGFEVRTVEIIGGIPAAPDTGSIPNSPSAAFVLQALLSVRFTP